MGFQYKAPPAPLTTAQRIDQQAANSLIEFARQCVSCFKQFWDNPVAIAAEWGVTAKGKFDQHAAAAAWIVPQLQAIGAPPSLIADMSSGIPTGWTVAFNDDGSGTITPPSA